MRNLLRVFCAIGDYFLLLISLIGVIYVRTDREDFNQMLNEYLKIFVWLFIVWIIVFYLFDLYNLTVPPRFTRFFFCLTLCFLGSITIFYGWHTYTNITPKTNLALIGVVFSLLYYFWRRIIDLIFINLLHGNVIMCAISDEDSLELVKKLYNNPRHTYKVKGALVTSKLLKLASSTLPKELIYTDKLAFEEAIKRDKILTIVATSEWFEELYYTMYDLLPRTIRIINVISAYERILGYIPVHSASHHWVMTNFDLVERRSYLILKRVFDILLAIVLLAPILILMILVTIMVKIFGESRAKAIYAQKRIGKDNVEFTLYKFRTMYSDAEKHGAQWAKEKDPRITKIGRILRLTRLDELPQIWNVIKGDMSFIGPRPERKEFVDQLEKKIPHYRLRHVIKPGLSGWAQTNFRYGSSIEDSTTKLCYDLYYVKNINILLDIRIFFRTIRTVFSAAGQ